MTDLSDFEKWLSRDYRPRTVHKYVTDLRSYLDNPAIAKNPPSLARAFDYQRAYAYYVEWLGVRGLRKPAGFPPPPPTPEPEKRDGRRRPRGQRKPLKTGIDRGSWERLWKLLDKDTSPEGYALAVLMSTGLRVADLLRVTPDTLGSAHRRSDGEIILEVKGGREVVSTIDAAPEAWADLYEAMKGAGRPENVAAFISPGSADPDAGGAAYAALRARLRKLAAEAEVEGPVHLHRLRRTVAGLAIEAGASTEEVQQILGHRSIKTTEIYTAGARAKMAAKGLRKIRGGG